MESASNSAEAPEAQWRDGFRKRIHNALEFLRGQKAFGKTQSRHFNAFNQTYLNDQKFRREVEKLSPFEMEVFCISSTLSQLEDDSLYFTAADVTKALALKLQDQKRGEIRDRKSHMQAYISIRRGALQMDYNYPQPSCHILALRAGCLSSLRPARPAHDKQRAFPATPYPL
ncbi:hypothetical protein F5883DRAFT_554501 [Diaporthe sp. PMI_573]|nr:hypothetical protein F5883DRAFT_554501 [Diaporthaceae sp. PMI_573]